MKMGIMLMSDTGPDGRPMDWRKHLATCKEHGVESVDLFDVMLQSVNTSPWDANEFLSQIGLSVSVFCVRTDLVSTDQKVRQDSLKAIEYGADVCRKLDVDHLFSHGGQHTNSGTAALASYINGLSEAADIVADFGITLSIENAGTLCNTDEEILQCINSVNRPNMKVTFDGGNFILAGCDPQRAAVLLAEKVIHVHAKSFEWATGVSERSFPDKPYKYCPIGRGLVDYRKISDTLSAVGFEGCFSFEPEGGESSRWYESLDALREAIKG
mgnify:CR=1 FL=1